MTNIESAETERSGKELFAGMDMSSYSKQVFGMFTGSEQTVKLRFENRLAGAVIDRFGKEVMLIPDGEKHFTVSADIAVSPQFYAWVFGFGTAVEILSPDSARQELAQLAKSVSRIYAD